MLLENPFRTEEWTYYVGNRLIAVAYVDALPEALSAIYCYYDPTESGPFAGNVQHSVAPRRRSRAGASARLPRLLRSGMSIDGIQTQVPPE